MDDEEEMEIPSPEGGGSSSGHFVIQGNPVISSPPQMVNSLKTISVLKLTLLLHAIICCILSNFINVE